MTKTITTLLHPYSFAARRAVTCGLVSVALLLASGCGDDSTSDDGAATGSTTETPTSSTTAEPPATDDGPSSGTMPGTTDGDTTSADSTSDGTTEGTDDSTGAAALEIAGTWIEDLGGGETVEHVIDETMWSQNASFGDSLFHVEAYDNAGRWVVAQGDAANEFFPELYSKFNWTWDGDALYYCTAVFDAGTAEEAMAAPDADAGDLATGCGGFPWSLLMPAA